MNNIDAMVLAHLRKMEGDDNLELEDFDEDLIAELYHSIKADLDADLYYDRQAGAW